MSQETIQKLSNEVLVLKGRLVDVSDALQASEESKNGYIQVISEICRVLHIDGSRGVDANFLIGAISALVPQPDPAEPEDETSDAE